MMNRMTSLLGLTAVCVIAGCATPSSVIKQPMTAKPSAVVSERPADGSIFQVSQYRPMLEDRRARFVGDTLTIVINENTNAGKDSTSTASKTGSASDSVTDIAKVPFLKPLQGMNVSASSANSYKDANSVNSGNNFTGNLTVTVVEVQPNGNLVVGGEKQVGLDKDTEYIRFAGVVNPDTIAPGNIVSSTQVADARIEYRTAAHIDGAEVTNWMARFFMSVMPF
ncbi:MAG: flagellar basal body L-ring protein FlgH [Thiobacillaceae bacterium]